MPRHQYSPEDVVYIVLSDERLFRICEIVYSSNGIVHSTQVASRLNMNPGYVYKLMKRLEKWGVLKGVKDPVNGKLAFRPTSTRVAQLLAEELRKRKAEELGDVLQIEKIETPKTKVSAE